MSSSGCCWTVIVPSQRAFLHLFSRFGAQVYYFWFVNICQSIVHCNLQDQKYSNLFIFVTNIRATDYISLQKAVPRDMANRVIKVFIYKSVSYLQSLIFGLQMIFPCRKQFQGTSNRVIKVFIYKSVSYLQSSFLYRNGGTIRYPVLSIYSVFIKLFAQFFFKLFNSRIEIYIDLLNVTW